MCFAVDRERAGAADTLATIRIESDRVFATSTSFFIDASIFAKNTYSGNAVSFVLDELALPWTFRRNFS